MSTEQICVALIGLGHIGRTHVAALAQVEGLELVAGCDHDPSLAGVLPPGVAYHQSHHALLASGGFDTVVVATPNRTHNTIACDVLKAGYHVIVEKPAATCPADLQRLTQLATAQQRHVYYAFHAAAAFEVDALVAHLAEHTRTYGPLTGFYSRFYDPYIDPAGHLLSHARSLDDCWSDSGVNALSVLDRVLPVDGLILAFRRQSGDAHRPPGVFSTCAGFHFSVPGTGGSAGFGVIDTAWDQGRNLKVTTLCYGHSGWRLQADHSSQTVTSFDKNNRPTQVAHFQGDRLLNHYLGLFADYRSRCAAGEDAMNTQSAHRIHNQLFAAMPPQ